MDHKEYIRKQVFEELRKVALPDSRFHYDFSSFIADFVGSREATKRLIEHEHYAKAKVIFVAPDNCLELLRYQALRDGKILLTTSYGIKRGFWLLDNSASSINRDNLRYASTLDGAERIGTSLTLQNMIASGLKVDLMVTGTGAINEEGVRFGKGHGYFDAEWGMLHRIDAIGTNTPVAAVVHDCQVLQQKLYPEIFDTVADLIFTPTRTIEVVEPHKPDCGIVWELLDGEMYSTIPPLQELKRLEESGIVSAN